MEIDASSRRRAGFPSSTTSVAKEFGSGTAPGIKSAKKRRCRILCGEPASPPSCMGWLGTPDRQAVFVCCGSCSDCSDAELEQHIVDKVSEPLTCIRPEMAVAAPPAAAPPAPEPAAVETATAEHTNAGPAAAARQDPATWAAAAAKDWIRAAAPRRTMTAPQSTPAA